MPRLRILLYAMAIGLSHSSIKHTTHHEESKEEPSSPSKNFFDCLRSCVSDDCSHSLKKLNLGIGCANFCETKCSELASAGGKGPKLRDVDPKYQNVCTGGVDPFSMTRNDYLLAFAKGPCSPVLFASGFMASKLIVQIDCKVLRETESEIFSKCGWNACEKKAYEFWKNVPDREYLAWIPDIISPISIFSLSEKSNYCFVSLVRTLYDVSKPIDKMYIARQGVKIRPYGFTPGTKAKNFCGAAAIVDLLNLSIQTVDSVGFKLAISSLEEMGYISGLTFQALPYNFFLTYHKNEFQLNFAKTLKRLRDFTGKRTVIYAHSFGNINTLHALKSLSLEEKKKLIFNWISITPPFSGAPKSQKTFVGGDDSFALFGGRAGFHFTSSVMLSLSQLSTYNLRMRDPFSYFSGQAWLEKVKKRIDYEKHFPQIPHEESGLLFWPKLSEMCHELRVKEDPRCFSGLYDTSNLPLFIYKGKAVYINQDQAFFTRHPIHPMIPQIYEKMKDFDIFDIKPEIPVILVFLSTLQTPATWKIDDNPSIYYKNNLFPDLKISGIVPGDSTLPSVSQLILPLKWALEFDEDPKNPSNQPVKFIEFSSLFKNDEPLYDKTDQDQEFRIEKNSYIGLRSDCMDKGFQDDSNCHHSAVVGDYHVVNLLIHAVLANQKVSTEDLESIQKISFEEIVRAENCVLYDLDIFKT